MSDPVSFQVFDIGASGLAAERTRINVVAQNIANAQVTKGPGGGPYRRQHVRFESVLRDAVARREGLPIGGVKVSVSTDMSPFHRVQDIGHPDADAEGWVNYPNVNVVDEMVDLMDAARSYEANLSALRTYKQMLEQTLQMAR